MRSTMAGFVGLVASAAAFAPGSSVAPELRVARRTGTTARGPTMQAVVRAPI